MRLQGEHEGSFSLAYDNVFLHVFLHTLLLSCLFGIYLGESSQMERDKREVYEITEEVTQVVKNQPTQGVAQPLPIPTVVPVQSYSYPYPVYSSPSSLIYPNQPSYSALSSVYSYNAQTRVESVWMHLGGDL